MTSLIKNAKLVLDRMGRDNSVKKHIDDLEKSRLSIILEMDDYDENDLTRFMLLEGLALVDAGINKLRQAELFKEKIHF